MGINRSLVSRSSPATAECRGGKPGGRSLGVPTSFVPDRKPLRLARRLVLSKPTFPEFLFGALRVAQVSGGFPPALLPRFEEAAGG